MLARLMPLGSFWKVLLLRSLLLCPGNGELTWERAPVTTTGGAGVGVHGQ